MSPEFYQLLHSYQRDINKLNNQRRVWLHASSIVLTGIIFLIFSWDWLTTLNSHKIWWVVISLMMIVSINWWYWTMRVGRVILNYQTIEYELLKNIVENIQEIRQDLKAQSLDNN